MQTHIVLIVDKSGSMSNVTDDTIGGFNTYLKGLKGTPRVNAMLFDTSFRVLFQNKTPKQATRLNKDNYAPSGGTALLDAVGKTLTELEFPKNDTVLCVIQTDGQENSSTEFTSDQVKSLVKERESEGWGFLYLGADHSAWEASRSIGISRGQTFVAPQSNTDEVKSYYSKLSKASNSFTDTSVKLELAVSSLNIPKEEALKQLGYSSIASASVATAAASYEEDKEVQTNVWTS